MENHLSVREARRQLAQVLNTAAFGDNRIVVVRYREEVGAFVGMDDPDLLRRAKPGPAGAGGEGARNAGAAPRATVPEPGGSDCDYAAGAASPAFFGWCSAQRPWAVTFLRQPSLLQVL